MKKIKSLFFLAFALLLASPAFALQCKDGTYEASDECWTDVRVSISETTPIITGTVLEYFGATDGTDANSFTVRAVNASADHAAIAGVAQSRIATGDYGRILVRGKGKLRKSLGAVSTRDYLYAAVAVATQDAGGVLGPVASTGAEPTAFALQSSGEARATIDAYIIVI